MKCIYIGTPRVLPLTYLKNMPRGIPIHHFTGVWTATRGYFQIVPSMTAFHRKLKTGFPHSCLQKNSTTFQDSQNVFPGPCHSPAMLNYRETAVTYSVYTVWQYNPSQNVHYTFRHGVLYIKGRLVKLNHWKIRGLSKTKLIFQDLEILGKIQDFPCSANGVFLDFS